MILLVNPGIGCPHVMLATFVRGLWRVWLINFLWDRLSGYLFLCILLGLSISFSRNLRLLLLLIFISSLRFGFILRLLLTLCAIIKSNLLAGLFVRFYWPLGCSIIWLSHCILSILLLCDILSRILRCLRILILLWLKWFLVSVLCTR